MDWPTDPAETVTGRYLRAYDAPARRRSAAAVASCVSAAVVLFGLAVLAGGELPAVQIHQRAPHPGQQSAALR